MPRAMTDLSATSACHEETDWPGELYLVSVSDIRLLLQVVRQILCLSNSDEEKLGLYKGSVSLLKDVPSGKYPPKEVSWLVATCFNQGCQHAKFGRNSSAVTFMETAIALLEFCPDLQPKQEVRFQLQNRSYF